MNSDDSFRTLFGVLGINAESSYDEVKRAFRFAKLASHPDRHENDPFAAERFKAITAAWELVDTAEKWHAYQAGAQAHPPRGASPHLSTPSPRHPPRRAGSIVIVYGYTQWFAINLTVHVFWNGVSVGSVKGRGRMSFEIHEDGEVSFKCSNRSASVRVKAGTATIIKISWNRRTGEMVPQVVGRGGTEI